MATSSPQTMERTRLEKSLWKELIWQPLAKMPKPIVLVFLGLMLMALSHSLLLFLVGPLLLAIMADVSRTSLSLSEILPQGFQAFVPHTQSIQVPMATLSFWLPWCILTIGALKSLSTYLYQVNQNYLSLNFAASFRESLFKYILLLPYPQLQKKAPGQWMSLIINDVHFLQSRFSELCLGLPKDLSIVCAAIVALAFIHPTTAIIILILAPLLALTMGRMGSRIAHFALLWQRELGRLTQALLSMRKRFEFIKAQFGEAHETHRFEQLNRQYFSHVRQSVMIRSGFAPWLEFIGISSFVTLIWLQGAGLIFHNSSGGEIFQIFAALGMLLRPLRNIGEQVAKFQETRGALGECLNVIKTSWNHQKLNPSPVGRSNQASPMPLTIEKFWVGYESEALVKAENLDLSRGKSIAIVGPSGGGKSTLLKTLAGLYPVIHYKSNVAYDFWHLNSSYVSQRPFLFDGTLRENLNYGIDHSFHEDEIHEVLAKVGLLDAFKQQNYTLETRISGLAPQLSGGQIQRLIIARLILQKRPLWLLDEPTSAVDPVTERELTLLLIQLANEFGKTLIMVTHRVQCLAAFSEVWFLTQGSLESDRTHSALLHNKSYAQFVMQES